MEFIKEKHIRSKKKGKRINREYNTALYLLRCVQLGLSYDDMEHLTYGMVEDMFIERENDELEYSIIADQSDFDKF